MAMPEQVRKQTEAVQQLYADLNTDADAPSPEGEGAPEEVVESVQTETVADSVPEPANESAPVEQGADQEDPNSQTFEQRWRTLQGMYDAEVPRLHAQNQELSQRLASMEQLIATMQAAPAPAPEPAPAPVSTLTDDEIEEYGESIDIMRKVSQEVSGQYQKQIADLQETIQKLQGQVVPRVEQIASQQAQSAEQSFWADLQTAVPNWREINEDQAFQAWLLEVDPLSGLSRQTYLDDAQRNLDSRRVAGFFTSWQSSTGKSVAQPSRAATELEKQVAPGKSRNAGAVPSNEPKTYTPQAIQDFFSDVRRGVYKGKEKERDAIERDIFAAQAEGRIVNA